MGHPGTMPVANKHAIYSAARTALALNCTLNEVSKFDRKNYYYPDLPKGYQISQYDQPIGSAGYFDIRIDEENERTEVHIRINRLHLEEDAAKLVHSADNMSSLVDFNRSSTPLMEIVTEPDLRTPLEAKIFLHELRLLARYLGVSSADMEKGHLRCDANVSVQFEHNGVEVTTPISEIKNLNSFRSVERALEFEAKRLYNDWMLGGETRSRTNKITVGWNDDTRETTLQRGKEEAHDYRYFPEPDIPPLRFSCALRDQLAATIPELPALRRTRMITEYGIGNAESKILVEWKGLGDFFEKSCSELAEWIPNKSNAHDMYSLLAGWLINKLCALIEERGITLETMKLTPENFAELISTLAEKKITSTVAQQLLTRILVSNESPRMVIRDEQLEQITNTSFLEEVCAKIISEQHEAVENYRKGKTSVIMFLVGCVMREMKGKGQPDLIRLLLEKLLAQ